MSEARLLQDIKNEPRSLAHVLSHQFGKGHGALLEAARCVREARTVVITGMGASLFASYPLQYEFAAMGINSTVIESGELLHYQQRLCSDAVVLLVSRSGESIEIAKLLPLIEAVLSGLPALIAANLQAIRGWDDFSRHCSTDSLARARTVLRVGV